LREYTIAAAIMLSRLNSKSLMRARRCRESMEEWRWLAADKSNLRFCNSNCLGYADAEIASSPSPTLAAHPSHKS